MPRYIPGDASRMECLVVSETLHRMQRDILSGTPSGQAVDQALEEVLELATRLKRERRSDRTRQR